MRRHLPLLTCTTVVCALVMAGCTHAQDSPPMNPAAATGTPTRAPLPTIPVDPQQVKRDEVVAAYEDLISNLNTYYQNGDYSIDAEARLISPRDPSGNVSLGTIVTGTGQLVDGIRQVGDVVVRDPHVAQYSVDGSTMQGREQGVEGYDQAVMEICIDPSKVYFVDAGGAQIWTGRNAFVATVTMESIPPPPAGEKYIGSGGVERVSDGKTYWWSVAGQSNDWGRSC